MGIAMDKKLVKKIVQIIIVIAVLIGIVVLNRLAIGNEVILDFMMRLGYSGIFLVSAVSGFNVFLPIPIIGFYPSFVEAGLQGAILIPLISAGMLVGDVFGYLIGHVGKNMIEERKKSSKIIQRLTALRDRHTIIPMIVLFIYAAVVPLPNELIVIPMAFMGYRLIYMLLALLAGNVIFNTLMAFGFLGINNLF